MGMTFTLTPAPVHLLAAGFQPIFQPIFQRFDAAGFDALDLAITVTPTGGNVTAEVWTGMQDQIDDGWLSLVSSGSQNTPITILKSVSAGFLRFLRWKVTALTGTEATVFVRGTGRSLGQRS